MKKQATTPNIDQHLLNFLQTDDEVQAQFHLGRLINDLGSTIGEIVSQSNDSGRDYEETVRQLTILLCNSKSDPQGKAISNFRDQVSKLAQSVYQEGQQNDFRRLLRWLDKGGDSSGQEYQEMRRRLVEYFDRKNCWPPDAFADRTFDRVTKSLVAHNKDYDPEPAKICYYYARLIFLEEWRQLKREQKILNCERPEPLALEEQVEQEKRLGYLEHCLEELSADDRNLIIQYYFGDKSVKIDNRKALKDELGLTGGALRTRVCRIREELKNCVKKRMGHDHV